MRLMAETGVRAGEVTSMRRHPQGGIFSPLLANTALSVLDEHVMAPWQPDGVTGTTYRPQPSSLQGSADVADRSLCGDFVVLVWPGRRHGRVARGHRDRACSAGIRFSEPKTRIVHMREGFDFLGFRIQWKRKRGTRKCFVYTFIADRPFRSVTAELRALTRRVSQADKGAVVGRSCAVGPTISGMRVQAHAQPAALLRQLAHHPLAAQTAHAS